MRLPLIDERTHRAKTTLGSIVVLTLMFAASPCLAQGGGGGGLSPDQRVKVLEIKIKALDIEIKAQQLKSGTSASKVTKAADDIASRARRIYDLGERILV